MDSRNFRQCQRADVNPDLFYSEKKSKVEAAKALCAACVARPACLLESFEVPGEDGIWAGYTKEEREDLRDRILLERAQDDTTPDSARRADVDDRFATTVGAAA